MRSSAKTSRKSTKKRLPSAGRITYAESARRWKSYSGADKKRIGEEGEAVYRDLLKVMDQDPGSEVVQKIVARWHQHLRYFYEPNVELLRGLGHMYNDDPRFAATFAKIHPDLAKFHQLAIDVYCDRLEGKQVVIGWVWFM